MLSRSFRNPDRGLTKFALVDWVELAFIDLEKAKTPEGQLDQARIARDAMHRQGFFYVINHGLDKATVSLPPIHTMRA